MTPERAGELCDTLDHGLRGSETNLTVVANTLVVVLRKEAWRRRRVRTGEIVECASFLELLTALPLKGFGEDPNNWAEAAAEGRRRSAADVPRRHHAAEAQNTKRLMVILEPSRQSVGRPARTRWRGCTRSIPRCISASSLGN